MTPSAENPIEPYLDTLLAHLRGSARDVRRALSESEAHLRDRAEALAAEGLPDDEAARRAISEFGDVRAVAAGFNDASGPARRRAQMASLLSAAWQLIGVGMIAIGISGAVAWVAMQATSTGAVFADPPGTHYSAGACSYWMHLHPSAATCANAALLEGRDDAFVQRFALGVLGIVVLLAFRWWKRRARRQPLIDVRAVSAVVAVAAFGLAGVFLTGYGVDRAVQNTGAGQWLASGGVALAFAIAYLITLHRAAPPWFSVLELLGDPKH